MDERFTYAGLILSKTESVGEGTLLLKDRANISNYIYCNYFNILPGRQREDLLGKLVIYDRVVEKNFHS